MQAFTLTPNRIKMLQLISNGMVERPNDIEDIIVIQDLCLANLTRKNHYINTYTLTNSGTEILRIYHSTQQSVSEANPAHTQGVEQRLTLAEEAFAALSKALSSQRFKGGFATKPILNPKATELHELSTVAHQLAKIHKIDCDSPMGVMLQLGIKAEKLEKDCVILANANEKQYLKLRANEATISELRKHIVGFGAVDQSAAPAPLVGEFGDVGYTDDDLKAADPAAPKPPTEDTLDWATPATQVDDYRVSVFESNEKPDLPYKWVVRAGDVTLMSGYTKFHFQAIMAADAFTLKYRESAKPTVEELVVKMKSYAEYVISAESCALKGHGNRVRAGNYTVCEICRTVLF